MKQVQIDEDLFLELYIYFTAGDYDEDAAERIRSALEEKFDKLVARKLFTDYKHAPTPADREAARQQYLDHAHISKSYRSPVETSL